MSAIQLASEKQKNELIFKKIRENSQDETKDLRDAADRTIAQTNKLINRLREQLGTATDNDVEPKIQELQVKINEAKNGDIIDLTAD